MLRCAPVRIVRFEPYAAQLTDTAGDELSQRPGSAAHAPEEAEPPTIHAVDASQPRPPTTRPGRGCSIVEREATCSSAKGEVVVVLPRTSLVFATDAPDVVDPSAGALRSPTA